MEQILQNKELMEKLAKVESPEALAALLADNDIKLEDGLTAEKFFGILKNPEAAEPSDELNADDLEGVSGGSPMVLGGILVGITAAKTIAWLLKKK